MRRIDRRDVALVVMALGLCLSATAKPPLPKEPAPVEVTIERNGSAMKLLCLLDQPDDTRYR